MTPNVLRIYSENNDFQYVEVLRRNRTKRQRAGAFFVEGVRSIERALAHGWVIESFIYAAETPRSKWASDILARSTAATHLELPPHLLAKLSQKEETSELLATIRIPADDLARIPFGEDGLVVILDRPSSHGNLGSIIRSCDALGAAGVVMTGHAVDLYDPQVVRASVGSLFAVPVVRGPSKGELMAWLNTLRAQWPGTQIVGTSAKADRLITETDFTRPTVLMIGNETQGLSYAYRNLCDCLVKIPIGGSATSLNVACATAIILYEINRQQGVRPGL